MIAKSGLEKNKFPKIIYVIIIVFIIGVLFLSILSNEKIMGVFFHHEEIPYSTVNDCIEASFEDYAERYPEDNPNDYKYKNSIYSYENDNQHVELLNTCNGRVWCYVFDKDFDGEKTTYKYNYSATVSLNDVWCESVKGYHFKIADNQQDIVSYYGKKPIVTRINYQYFNDYYENYLLFVDDTLEDNN